VSHHAHKSSLKKGKDDKRSKNINDGHVSLITPAHDQSTGTALLLRDILFAFTITSKVPVLTPRTPNNT